MLVSSILTTSYACFVSPVYVMRPSFCLLYLSYVFFSWLCHGLFVFIFIFVLSGLFVCPDDVILALFWRRYNCFVCPDDVILALFWRRYNCFVCPDDVILALFVMTTLYLLRFSDDVILAAFVLMITFLASFVLTMFNCLNTVVTHAVNHSMPYAAREIKLAACLLFVCVYI